MPAMRLCSFWSLKHQSVALLLNACYALVFLLEFEASMCVALLLNACYALVFVLEFEASKCCIIAIRKRTAVI